MIYKTICKTDADFLLCFRYLENDGFVFTYVKKENNNLRIFVNCNGKIFGPFDRVTGPYGWPGPKDGSWIAYRDGLILEYSDNGNICETRNSSKGSDTLSQNKTTSPFSFPAKRKTNIGKDFYNPETHVLKTYRKNRQYFVTDKNRYGAYYKIVDSEYFDENHFHFTYRKRKNSKRLYYNYNGKEIGPFYNCHGNLHYYKQKRLILDNLDGNYIFINGDKNKIFNAPYKYCEYHNTNGHEIITGIDSDRNTHFKRDGIEAEISAGIVYPLDNGDVVYSKKENDTETWFYNDTPISITVEGIDSKIYNSIITYKRSDSKGSPNISYFMLEGREYNGEVLESFCKGFIIWLQNGRILSAPYNFLLFHPHFDHNCFYANHMYDQQRAGNFLRLFNTQCLAGRD